MQTIEFESKIQNGFVKLPEEYKDWHNKTVKVVLFRKTEADHDRSDKQKLSDFFKQFNADLSGYRFDRNEANER